MYGGLAACKVKKKLYYKIKAQSNFEIYGNHNTCKSYTFEI